MNKQIILKNYTQSKIYYLYFCQILNLQGCKNKTFFCIWFEIGVSEYLSLKTETKNPKPKTLKKMPIEIFQCI
jgi:hypothetical protein